MTINECIEDIKNNINCFDTVFIDGEWGIGKTYPFEHTNKNCILENTIYISVFGISSINDLYEKFYDKLFILNEKNVDEITKAISGVEKHGKHIIDILLKFKVFALLNLLFDDINLKILTYFIIPHLCWNCRSIISLY